MKSTIGPVTPEPPPSELSSISGGAVGALTARHPPLRGGIRAQTDTQARLGGAPHSRNSREKDMNNLIWLVGAVVIILFIFGYFGLR